MNDGTICQRPEAKLLRQGRRHRLPSASRWPRPAESASSAQTSLLLIYGDAFWPTYTTGDNTNLVATDSMKNFIQRETMNFTGGDLESYFVPAEKFLDDLSAGGGRSVHRDRNSLAAWPGRRLSFAPAGPDRRLRASGNRRGPVATVEVRSGIRGFRLLRLGGSAFQGFVRDQYTTLPDIEDRPLHMWLDLDWSYTGGSGVFSRGAYHRSGARLCAFRSSAASNRAASSRSSTRSAREYWQRFRPSREINLEANNRTWDTIAEQGTRWLSTPMRVHLTGAGTDSAPLRRMARWPESPRMFSISRSGKPAAGIRVELLMPAARIASATTNADGRTDAPLALPAIARTRRYELIFHAGRLSAKRAKPAISSATSSFASHVPTPPGNYHVPLLLARAWLQHVSGIMTPLARKVIDAAVRSPRTPNEPGRITRTFLSPPMRGVHRLLGDGCEHRHARRESTRPAICAAVPARPRSRAADRLASRYSTRRRRVRRHSGRRDRDCARGDRWRRRPRSLHRSRRVLRRRRRAFRRTVHRQPRIRGRNALDDKDLSIAGCAKPSTPMDSTPRIFPPPA